MPKVHGKLRCYRPDTDQISAKIGVPIDRASFFDTAAPLPDKVFNPENLALDPLSIAFAKAMGFSWVEVAQRCAMSEDGISFEYDASNGGCDILNLPEDHPCIAGRSFYDRPDEKIVGGTPDLIGCGNQSAYLVLSGEAIWETIRCWPDDGGDYTDIGTLSLTRPVPTSAGEGLVARAEAGNLFLADVFDMPDLGLNPIIHEVVNGDWTLFKIHFPSGGGSYSVMPTKGRKIDKAIA